jgi:hypothetical protein
MASTYTSNLGIELPADGELDGVWGDVVNDNMNILDRGINGTLTLSLSGTSSTLTTSDGALSDGQYKLLVLAGSPSGTHTITLSPNDAQKIYFVRNTTAQSVVFTQGSGGNVTIATGDSGIIYADGAGSGAAIANLTDHFAMSSVNITGGSITGVNPIVMTGGSINGTPIGASTPSTIAGTTGTFSGDVTVADKIIHSGDTNTTIRFPSADTVTVETNGSERMRISSAGNVGIGTTTDAAALLEVSSSTDPTAVFIAFISGTTMTVTGITSGALAVGDRVFGTGVEWNTVITAQTSGTSGSSGNYTVNNSQTVSSNPGISMSSAASGKSVLRLTNTDTTEAAGQTTGGVEFFSSDASTPGAGVKGYVAVIAESATPDSAMIFGTSNDTASTLAVERMRIDSSGNIGIGTKSPTVALDVVGAGKFTGNLTVDTNTLFVDASNNRVGIGTTTPAATLEVAGSATLTAATTESRSINVGTGRSGNGTAALDLIGDATYTSYGLRVIRGNTGANTSSSILHRGTGTLILSAEDSAPMEFYTNGSRAMRIGSTQVITMDNLAGSGSRAVNANASGVLSAASDSRLKHEVIAPIPGLAEIMQLEPRAYKWIDDIEKRGENAAVEIGFFADQVKDIIPSAAPMGNDGYYGFYDRAVVAALTKAVQEQQAIITALEARLTALETVR